LKGGDEMDLERGDRIRCMDVTILSGGPSVPGAVSYNTIISDKSLRKRRKNKKLHDMSGTSIGMFWWVSVRTSMVFSPWCLQTMSLIPVPVPYTCGLKDSRGLVSCRGTRSCIREG
jgi:hypothetical protein